jgi:hypothetical protein
MARDSLAASVRETIVDRCCLPTSQKKAPFGTGEREVCFGSDSEVDQRPALACFSLNSGHSPVRSVTSITHCISLTADAD